jgi:murein DD-endopeptidase MepM/ murein hydrolase activator NlpD
MPMSGRGVRAMLLVATTALTPACGTRDGDAAPTGWSGGPFRMPLEDPMVVDRLLILGVDHDPGTDPLGARCRDRAGRDFPWCYDGHDGTDYLLAGGFETMDAGSAWIVAAAAGRVTRVEDGHYDRCHGELATREVTCDGQEMAANFVAVEHDGGLTTLYYHMKRGSPVVRAGDAVTCGQRLGLVGSSGMSVTPHLHFQVERAGAAVDPYAGPHSQPETLWHHQPDDPADLPVTECP